MQGDPTPTLRRLRAFGLAQGLPVPAAERLHLADGALRRMAAGPAANHFTLRGAWRQRLLGVFEVDAPLCLWCDLPAVEVRPALQAALARPGGDGVVAAPELLELSFEATAHRRTVSARLPVRFGPHQGVELTLWLGRAPSAPGVLPTADGLDVSLSWVEAPAAFAEDLVELCAPETLRWPPEALASAWRALAVPLDLGAARAALQRALADRGRDLTALGRLRRGGLGQSRDSRRRWASTRAAAPPKHPLPPLPEAVKAVAAMARTLSAP